MKKKSFFLIIVVILISFSSAGAQSGFVFSQDVIHPTVEDTAEPVVITIEPIKATPSNSQSGSVFDKLLPKVPATQTPEQNITTEVPVENISIMEEIKNLFPNIAYDEKSLGLYGWQDDLEDGKKYLTRFQKGAYHTIFSASAPFTKGDSYGEFFQSDIGPFTDFALHADITLSEIRPADGYGDCILSYTNSRFVDEGTSNWFDVELGYNIDAYNSSSQKNTFWYDLSKYWEIGRTFGVDIIRQNGFTDIYIDGEYIGEAEDGISGEVTVWFGTFVDKGSQYVDCSYDNFEIRTK